MADSVLCVRDAAEWALAASFWAPSASDVRGVCAASQLRALLRDDQVDCGGFVRPTKATDGRWCAHVAQTLAQLRAVGATGEEEATDGVPATRVRVAAVLHGDRCDVGDAALLCAKLCAVPAYQGKFTEDVYAGEPPAAAGRLLQARHALAVLHMFDTLGVPVSDLVLLGSEPVEALSSMRVHVSVEELLQTIQGEGILLLLELDRREPALFPSPTHTPGGVLCASFGCEALQEISRSLVILWNSGVRLDWLSYHFHDVVCRTCRGNWREGDSLALAQSMPQKALQHSCLPTLVELPPSISLPATTPASPPWPEFVNFVRLLVDSYPACRYNLPFPVRNATRTTLHALGLTLEQVASAVAKQWPCFVDFTPVSGREYELADIYLRLLASLSLALPALRKRCPFYASPVQKEFFFLNSVTPLEQSSMYGVYFCCKLPEQALDTLAFQRVCRRVLSQHDLLRAKFSYAAEDSALLCCISASDNPAALDFDTEILDTDNDAEVHRRVAAYRTLPFDIENGQFARVRLMITARPCSTLLFFGFHHIVADLFSAVEFLRAVEDAYCHGDAVVTHRVLPPQQYAHIAWKTHCADTTTSPAYWQSVLSGAALQVPLPQCTNLGQSVLSPSANCCSAPVHLDPRLGRLILRATKLANATPFAVLLSMWLLYVHHLAQRDDVVIAVAATMRDLSSEKEAMCCLANTLPVRSRSPHSRASAVDYIHAIHQQVQASKAHRFMPFNKVVASCFGANTESVTTQLAGRPTVFFGFQRLQEPYEEFGAHFLMLEGYQARPLFGGKSPSLSVDVPEQYPLEMVMLLGSSPLAGSSETSFPQFCGRLHCNGIPPHLVRCWAEQFGAFCLDQLSSTCSFASPPQVCPKPLSVGTVPLAHRHLGEWLFSVAQTHQSDVAVSYKEKRHTYGQLLDAAQSLQMFLSAHGGPGPLRVATLLPPSLECAVAPAACWLCGFTVVPLDVNSPAARLRGMTKEAMPLCLLAHERTLELAHSVCDGVCTVVCLRVLANGRILLGQRANDDCSTITMPFAPPDTFEEAAYIMYTSGSTGVPKGVVVPHTSVMNFVVALEQTLTNNPAGTTYKFDWSSLRQTLICLTSFDVSMHEILFSFLHGGRLEVCPSRVRVRPDLVAQWLKECDATCTYIPPFILKHWAAAPKLSLPSIRFLLTGVEPVTFGQLEACHLMCPGAVIVNAYGPTEATIFCTVEKFLPGSWSPCPGAKRKDRVPIGEPLANCCAHLLDPETHTPVPYGAQGEIFVSGSCVASGYLNRTEATAAAFVFLPSVPGARLYRTGDIAQYTDGGRLLFLCRKDRQIKMHGTRVEAGEIEHAVLQCAGIRACVVAPLTGGLVAVFAEHDTAAPQRVTHSSLLSHLHGRLPAVMLPHYVLLRDAFPLTNNGKVDVHALLREAEEHGFDSEEGTSSTNARTSLPTAAAAVPALLQQPELSVPVPAAFNSEGAVAKKIMDCCVRIFALDGTVTVPVDVTFAALGATSLNTFRLFEVLVRWFPSLQLGDFLRYPSPASLAAHLAGRTSAPVIAVGPCSIPARVPVAIVGMAFRGPGGASSLEGLWDQVITRGEEQVESVWAEGAVMAACGVIRDADRFDCAAIGMSEAEAAAVDPQQRLFLEVCYHALEDAGHFGSDACRVGVFCGVAQGGTTYRRAAPTTINNTEAGMNLLLGSAPDFVPARAAFQLGLAGGPCVCVGTACSSSLVAIHLGTQALWNGECDLAVCGGVSLLLPQQPVKGGLIYSFDGHCRPFDQRRTGTVLAHGAGAVCLARRGDAVSQRAYAEIVGTAVGNDGHKASFTSPSADGQQAVMQQCFQLAETVVPSFSVKDIRLFEAHATATLLGDQIEAEAASAAFCSRDPDLLGNQSCLITSVKAALGHLNTASGIASLVRAALCVDSGVLPAPVALPGGHLVDPLLHLPLTPFYTANQHARASPSPWPSDVADRYASVNSLGLGGTNAHIVLRKASQALRAGMGRRRRSGIQEAHHAILFSAKTPQSLYLLLDVISNYVQRHKVALLLEDLSYALRCRPTFEYRQFIVCHSVDTFLQQVRDVQSARVTAAGSTTFSIAFRFVASPTSTPRARFHTCNNQCDQAKYSALAYMISSELCHSVEAVLAAELYGAYALLSQVLGKPSSLLVLDEHSPSRSPLLAAVCASRNALSGGTSDLPVFLGEDLLSQEMVARQLQQPSLLIAEGSVEIGLLPTGAKNPFWDRCETTREWLLRFSCEAWQYGLHVDWKEVDAIFPPPAPALAYRPFLPGYAFDHSKSRWLTDAPPPVLRPTSFWLSNAFLLAHSVNNIPLVPFAAYIAMARKMTNSAVLRDLQITRPILVVEADTVKRGGIAFHGEISSECISLGTTDATSSARAFVLADSRGPELREDDAEASMEEDHSTYSFYKELLNRYMFWYGPQYRVTRGISLRRLSLTQVAVSTRVIAEHTAGGFSTLEDEIALLDGCLQGVAAACLLQSASGACGWASNSWLPASISRIEIAPGRLPSSLDVHAVISHKGENGGKPVVEADVAVYEHDTELSSRKLIARFTQLRLLPAGSASLSLPIGSSLGTLVWLPEASSSIAAVPELDHLLVRSSDTSADGAFDATVLTLNEYVHNSALSSRHLTVLVAASACELGIPLAQQLVPFVQAIRKHQCGVNPGLVSCLQIATCGSTPRDLVSALCAFARSASAESGSALSLIEFAGGVDLALIRKELFNSLCAGPGLTQCKYDSAGTRYVQHVVPHSRIALKAGSALRGKTWVVTGGGGGVGHELCRWLLTFLEAASVVCLDKAFPDGEACDTRQRNCVCDVTNAEELYLQLALVPRVSGVFHLAGANVKARCVDVTPEMLALAFAGKYCGALALRDAVLRMPPLSRPPVFVFSSLAGAFGAPGQACYAAANAAVESLAGTIPHCTCIAWCAWAGTGMAASVKQTPATTGPAITPSAALEALHFVMCEAVEGEIVQVYPPGLAGSPELDRHLRQLPAFGSSADQKTAGAAHGILCLADAEKFVASIVTGEITATELPCNVPLAELGLLDSLASIRVHNALSRLLGGTPLGVTPAAVPEYTLSGLATLLWSGVRSTSDHVSAALKPQPDAPPSTGTTASASYLNATPPLPLYFGAFSKSPLHVRSIVPLREGPGCAHAVPLVAVAPWACPAEWYAEMLPFLPPDQPLYALQNPALPAPALAPSLETLDQLTDIYVDLVRCITRHCNCPRVALLGLSYSCLLATAVARRLVASAASTASPEAPEPLLMLLDPVRPPSLGAPLFSDQEAANLFLLYFAYVMARLPCDELANKLADAYAATESAAQAEEGTPRWTDERVWAAFFASCGYTNYRLDALRTELRTSVFENHLSSTFSRSPLVDCRDCCLVVLASESDPFERLALARQDALQALGFAGLQTGRTGGATMGVWLGELLRCGVHCVRCRGNHFSLMDPENLAGVMAAVVAWLYNSAGAD
eukprot:TRINITY_DN818_c0_g1_i1.p1 TRINITY_DN818_c0_g1~~TRINITY_DN818_c0_g1_i1.p1  ORF type:complete len:3452 (-),score=431.49 TRINITY_DN818_c0_g1_i1:49-10404(-)